MANSGSSCRPPRRDRPPPELRAALARRFPGVPLIAGAARRAWRRHARRHWEAAEPFVSPALSGALIAFRRDAWTQIGPFDEAFRLYFEETDWLLRLAAGGLDSRFVPAARAVHLFAQSSMHEPRATAWFGEAERLFRRRHLGRGVTRLLAALGAAPPRTDSARASVASPAISLAGLSTPRPPAWVEIALASGGFPAAGERLSAVAGGWQMPDEIWRRLPPGELWIRGVDRRGRESAPLHLRCGERSAAAMSADGGYTLRAYAPGDEAAIQRAFTEVFGVQRTLAEWRWKFVDPPRGSRIVLAFDAAGELACQYAAITVDVEWGARRCWRRRSSTSSRVAGAGSVRAGAPSSAPWSGSSPTVPVPAGSPSSTAFPASATSAPARSPGATSSPPRSSACSVRP